MELFELVAFQIKDSKMLQLLEVGGQVLQLIEAKIQLL